LKIIKTKIFFFKYEQLPFKSIKKNFYLFFTELQFFKEKYLLKKNIYLFFFH